MKALFVAVLLLLLQTASAYEVETHVRFSQKAVTCSVLKDQGLMDDLGLKGLEDEDPMWREPIDTRDDEPGKWIAKWIEEYNKAKKFYQPTICIFWRT